MAVKPETPSDRRARYDRAGGGAAREAGDVSKPGLGWWFGLFTDCLCITTTAVLTGLLTHIFIASIVTTAVVIGLLYWWRGRDA